MNQSSTSPRDSRTEFTHTVKRIRVKRLQKLEAFEQMRAAPESGRMLRLYCEARATSWSLQVRGPIGTGFSGLRDGKDFAIATASLSHDDMIALRDAINAQLDEAR